jgi:hypothetical protein
VLGLFGFLFSSVLGFAVGACPPWRTVFLLSSVLGFACPVSEIGALFCGRRLSAGVDGSSIFSIVFGL